MGERGHGLAAGNVKGLSENGIKPSGFIKYAE
jgi:hypothetical protein